MVYDQDNDRLRKKAMEDPKRKIITRSDAEMEKRYTQIFKAFHDEWIKSTPDGQKKYDALKEIIADIRKGQ